jgi:predicted transcriptional regulator
LIKISKLISLLEISLVAGLISEMNKNVIVFELNSLIQNLTSSDKIIDPKSLVFPSHLFEVQAPEIVQKSDTKLIKVSPVETKVSDRLSVKKQAPKQKDNASRQDIIISLLKKKDELGIKDFVSSISGCSEKTIQRELASLVSKGLIKKEGEKRWSRYSLNRLPLITLVDFLAFLCNTI